MEYAPRDLTLLTYYSFTPVNNYFALRNERNNVSLKNHSNFSSCQ